MGCLLEIGLLIYGIVILARAEMSLGGGRVARGAPAYFAALLFIFPLPAALMLGVFLGLTNPQLFKGGPTNIPIELVMVEWGLLIGCLVLGLIIAYAGGQPAGFDRRARRDDDDDYHRRRDEDYDRDRDRGRGDYPPRQDAPPDDRFGTGRQIAEQWDQPRRDDDDYPPRR